MDALKVDLAWKSDQCFEARDASGHLVQLDGNKVDGFSPTEALLASTAACMGIDVVMILKKMRTELAGLRMSIEGDRMADPPRYFHRVHLRFEIEGDVPREKAERAVKLSFDKYCSVFHTLRKDIAVETEIEIQPG